MLEDARYFCVDNLPIPLMSKFVSLMAGMQGCLLYTSDAADE